MRHSRGQDCSCQLQLPLRQGLAPRDQRSGKQATPDARAGLCAPNHQTVGPEEKVTASEAVASAKRRDGSDDLCVYQQGTSAFSTVVIRNQKSRGSCGVPHI